MRVEGEGEGEGRRQEGKGYRPTARVNIWQRQGERGPGERQL